MQRLERLYDAASVEGIKVISAHFSNSKKSACMHKEQLYKVILLDRSALTSQAEEIDILSEEVGHYKTGALYLMEAAINTPSYRSAIRWCEDKARRWKITHVLSLDSLLVVFNAGIVEVWELAEYFDLTESFIREALHYYREVRGEI